MEEGRFRRGIVPVGLLIGSIGVGIILAELVLRVLGISYGNIHMEFSAILHHAHTRNHGFISYHPSHEYGGHLVYYDDEGLRALPGESTENEGTPDFIAAFLGDSFVEAIQVSHENSFVGRLEAGAPDNIRTSNYGTSSYSPLLYLLQWRTQIRIAAPTHVFLMLYGNDVRNDEAMARIATYDQTGAVVSVPGPKQTWATRLGRMSHLGRFLNMVRLRLLWVWEHRGEERAARVTAFIEENPDLTDLTDRHLRQLAVEFRESGAELALMAVPSKERTVHPELREDEPSFADKVQEWANDNAIPYIDLTPAFYAAADEKIRVFLGRDIHFTTDGHQLVADVLTKACPKLFSQGPGTKKCVAR